MAFAAGFAAALVLVFGPDALASATPRAMPGDDAGFTQIPGEREFTGELIVRPKQDLLPAERDNVLRELGAFASRRIDCTDECVLIVGGVPFEPGAAENGAKVISTSYSGIGYPPIETTGQYVRSLGASMLWAAGNSDTDHSSWDFEHVIFNSCDFPDAEPNSESFGWGRINLRRAVDDATDALVPQPPVARATPCASTTEDSQLAPSRSRTRSSSRSAAPRRTPRRPSTSRLPGVPTTPSVPSPGSP